ncbi:hypothetical protein [Arthrobacter sp. H14]|uniref:hypothetical protein n=1 Tax=Arthrobacter sp. H14 TaxID=1312959 RepID=UPI0004B19F60|nr:hypothetical protein [Arthrobacter sp. H14]
MESQLQPRPQDDEPSGATLIDTAVPDEAAVPLFTRRQVGVMASGGAFLLAGAAGVMAWARGNTGARGRQTSFGTVEIRKAERRPRLSASEASATGVSSGHNHGGTGSLEPGNHTWADVVLVELEVQNLQNYPILLSPGQLRLKVGDDGIGVTPNGTGRQSGPIAAGATERFAISYLAPSDTDKFSAEFSDPWEQRIVPLELPTVRNRPAMEARL